MMADVRRFCVVVVRNSTAVPAHLPHWTASPALLAGSEGSQGQGKTREKGEAYGGIPAEDDAAWRAPGGENRLCSCQLRVIRGIIPPLHPRWILCTGVPGGYGAISPGGFIQ